jgi:hypothetical protein
VVLLAVLGRLLLVLLLSLDPACYSGATEW